MDTPEKCQIQTPASKFEDSPVFNFINNLSPIEPVKTTRISQTFNSLTFTTIPSIFASPHLHTNRDSRFLRRPGCYRPIMNELDSREYFTASVQTSAGPSSPTGQNMNMVVSTSDEGQSSPGHGVHPSPPLTETPGSNTDDVIHFHEVGARSMSKEGNPDSDWECLISDSAGDLLCFNSPEHKKAFPGFTRISTSTEPASSEKCKNLNPEPEDPAEGPSSRFLTGVTGDSVNDGEGKCLPPSSEPISVSHRGLRRRCLVFEMTGAHRRSLNYTSDHCPNSDPINPEGDPDTSPSSCILPGIGLHLNSLALSDSRSPDLLPLNLQASLSPYEPASSSMAMSCVDTDKDSADNDGRFASDDISGSQIMDEICQSSPRKKKLRLSQGGENDNCKRCNCKKSKCLKLYCECFSAGVYCADPCSCLECFNKSSHEDMVLTTRQKIVSRNPLAFAPKVIQASDPIAETGEDSNMTPASARHKRGCNCKKSNCLKKYCECYQGGVGCSMNCRCEGCKNTFGRKEGVGGSSPDEEPETVVSSGVGEQSLRRRMTLRTKQEQITHLPLLATPLNICRPSDPFSANNKLPPGVRSSTSSSDISTGLENRESRICKEGEEIPEILSSPNSGVKSASPNSKRVSPPERNIAVSPSRRGGRKLILHSIPAFPSLTPGPS